MGSKNKSSTVQNPATVWNPQTAYLQDMYQQAQNQFNNSGAATAQSQGYLNDFASQLGNSQAQLGNASNSFNAALDQYYGAGRGIESGYGALNQAQTGYQSFMNPGVNPMQDVYRRQIARAFSEDIMPELQGQQMMTGGFGGSRGQIGEALAGARASQQLQDFSAELYNQDMNRKLGASQGLAGLGGQYGNLAGQQANIGLGIAGVGAQQGNLAQAYGNLGLQYGGLSQMQQQLPWYALQQYAGLLGAPTVLGGGGSSTTTQSGGIGSVLSGIGSLASIGGLFKSPIAAKG